jgi:O-antigen/teichoic acid export membrane protein
MTSPLKRFSDLCRPCAGSVLFRHALVYLIGDLLIRAGSLVLVPVYTRTLPLGDYGALAVATSVATVVSYIAGLALSAAVIKLGPEFAAGDQPAYATNNVVKFAIIWGAFVCGLFVVIVPPATSLFFKSPDLVMYNRLAVVSGCLTGVTGTLLAVLQSNGTPVKYRLVTVCSFTANVATGLVAVLLLKLAGLGAMIGQLVGAGCGCVAALVAARADIRAPFDRQLIWRALGIGVPLTVYSLGAFSTDQLSRIFIERYVSAAALGPYNIAFLYCTSSLAIIFGAVNTAWVPQFFQLKKNESVEQTGYYGTAVIIAAVSLGGVLVLLAPIAIWLIAGSRYSTAANYVPILMVNAIISGPVWSLFMNPLVLVGRNWTIAQFAIISGSCNVVLNLVVTPYLGAWGAAASSMVSLLVLTILSARYSARVFPAVYDIQIIVQVGLLVVLICTIIAVADITGTIGIIMRFAMAIACAVLAYYALNRQRLKFRDRGQGITLRSHR